MSANIKAYNAMSILSHGLIRDCVNPNEMKEVRPDFAQWYSLSLPT
jgi:hypothetical protein